MKIRGAIFDLDGTLLDSMEIWDRIGCDYLKSMGKVPHDGLREVLRPLSLYQTAEYFRSQYGLRFSAQEIMGGVNKMLEHFYTEVAPAKEGALHFLKSLKQKGVKMCVATATDRYLAEAALKRNGMLGYFEGIFTCSEVGYGKDCPEIFLQAQKSLGTNIAETYVFEDALFAIQTAKAEGFQVVGVYDKTAQKQQAEIQALANIYITSFDEMRKYL